MIDHPFLTPQKMASLYFERMLYFDIDTECLMMVKEIKKHKEPPERADDIYNQRSPWNKLGTDESAHIGGMWVWYYDAHILRYATKEELKAALDEFEREENERSKE